MRPKYFIFNGNKIKIPVIQNDLPKDVMQDIQDVMRAECVVPLPGEPIGPKKPLLPTPKMILTDEESQQLITMEKTFPEAVHIIMYEEDSVIQIDFDGTPVIHPDVIRNLEDRGYGKLAEFPCKCNCGGYSLLMAREF